MHATADGHLVVCHDGTVDRTTSFSGAIASITLADLRRMDNAYWWAPGADVSPGLADGSYPHRGKAPGDRHFGFATLDEVLDVLEAFPDVALNLDIKSTAPMVEPYEERLARTLLARPGADRVIVASFLDSATEALSAMAPSLATSAGTAAVAAFYRAVQAGEPPPATRHVALQVPARTGDLVLVDDRFVEAAHRTGLAVHVWTINDEDEMGRLLDLGVDGIITDRPTPLVELLDRRGLAFGA